MFANAEKSRAVIFNYLTNTRFMLTATPQPVRLKGLDASKNYTVKEINVYPGTISSINSGTIYSGNFLMTVGINPDVHLGRASVLLEVNEVK